LGTLRNISNPLEERNRRFDQDFVWNFFVLARMDFVMSSDTKSNRNVMLCTRGLGYMIEELDLGGDIFLWNIFSLEMCTYIVALVCFTNGPMLGWRLYYRSLKTLSNGTSLAGRSDSTYCHYRYAF
jgi:hypothetical protein